MKYLFHLGHPAHFHLFKHTINSLKNRGHEVVIAIKKKDVLEDLLKNSKLDYTNLLPEGRKSNIVSILIGLIKQDIQLLRLTRKEKPNYLIGCSPILSHVGKILRIPSIILSEDDADQVKQFSYLTYPFASKILSPISCENGKWNFKTIKYDSFHELAYLHPNNFKIDEKIILNICKSNESYFLIRFSSLNAYHDTGKTGLTEEFTEKIINILEQKGKVFIISEKKLPSKFEKYELKINPLDIHHFIGLATIFIGDSQTMCAEAGVLGVPFIRINDFVGKLAYLNELELKYKLGYGYLPREELKILDQINKILTNQNLKKEWNLKLDTMLKEKFELNLFLVWYFENYNASITEIEKKLMELKC